MTRSKVAVLKTKPETVLQDIEKLMKLADFEKHLDKNSTTILKDKILKPLSDKDFRRFIL